MPSISPFYVSLSWSSLMIYWYLSLPWKPTMNTYNLFFTHCWKIITMQKLQVFVCSQINTIFGTYYFRQRCRRRSRKNQSSKCGPHYTINGYYHWFVKYYAHIASALTDLLKQPTFIWNENAAQAFKKLKVAMSTLITLA